MRRPIDRPALVSGDRNSHAEYGIGPATDYALPPGAKIITPFDGTLSTWNSTTGGETLVCDDGAGIVVSVQHINNLASGRAREGAVCALVDGYNDWHGTAWDGPHAHVWASLHGERLSFEELIERLGGKPAPIWSVASPTLSDFAGTTTPINPARARRRHHMTLFYLGQGDGSFTYALAGDYPGGGPANWQEFQFMAGNDALLGTLDDERIAALRSQFGDPIGVDLATFQAKRDQYLRPMLAPLQRSAP